MERKAMKRTPDEQQVAAPKTLRSKQSGGNHSAQFMPARDSRNRRVPGLYIRNGRFYCQLWVEASLKGLNPGLRPTYGAQVSQGYFYQKKRRSRHNFKSAASIILMSVSPEPPERLAEILQEILALSNSTRTSRPESARGSDPIGLFDADCVKKQSQRKDEEGKNAQRL